VATETSVLGGLEPRAFWRHFEELSAIARVSRLEEPAIEHVRAWSTACGYSERQDAARNLVVDVPATPGREAAPVVVLQGHLDMVCERRPDSPNDPAEGRIELVVEGDWVMADGTTLGADNGVGIAAMMAFAEDESLPHGPLQLLMTVAEEVGLEGANGLDGSLVRGTVLVNLDSGADGRLTVGCAGSTDTWLRVSLPREPVGADALLEVSVSGGLGGHSGGNINQGRSNAIKALGRALREAYSAVEFRLVSLDGGKSRNAIPRDAVAVVAVTRDRESELRDALAAAAASTREAFAETDPGVDVTVGPAAPARDAWTEQGTAALLDAIALVPTGPLALSRGFAGMVETSTSLGEALTDGDVLMLHSLSRSSNDAALPEVIGTLDALARLTGGELEVKHNYPGWRPNLDSPALTTAKRVYERLFGEPPIVTAVHGGIEPAVIGDKVPGLDMISFGPQIEAPHSPDERLGIPSVERFWRLLAAVLDELSLPRPAA
jgi:dipeptidase D